MKIVKADNGSDKLRISKKEWESIGKLAGWRGEVDRSDLDYGSSSPQEMTIALWDPQTEEEVEAQIMVEFSVEPTETEDGFLFYQGGVQIEDVKLNQDLSIDNGVYPSGTDLSVISEYIDAIADGRVDYNGFIDSLSEEVQEGGVQVPVNKYRGGWR